MIPKETVDKIMDSAIIEEVIGDFVTLKKSGTTFKGLSPFTSEKTPSFYVVPHKAIFKCFSSGKGGNVVNFLMEHEKFSYPEALRWLADKYGIEIEEEEMTPEQMEAQTMRESLGIVSQFASDHFQHNLWETDSGKAIGLSYLRERGYRDDIIKKFQLGYCLEEWEHFTNKALEKGYELKYLTASGLSREKNGKAFDFFHGRIMFPIRNISGKVIAFGGRTLKSDKKVAKYFNSPESDLYNKSRVLFGIDTAKAAIVKQDLCYLVEGYTDVISLHQNDVENVVASAGTALTDDQIRLIKRYTSNVCMLFDGDAAGIRASFRGIDLLLQQGLNVKVVSFPDGEDPDSFASKTPSSEFQNFLKDNAKDFIVFKGQILSKEADHDPIKRAEMISDIVSSIAKIPDGIKRSVYIKECSSLLDVEESVLVAEMNKRIRSQFKKETGFTPVVDFVEHPPIQPQASQGPKDSLAHQERDLIRLLLNYGGTIIEMDSDDEKKQEISVGEFLIHALDEDKMVLTDTGFNTILCEYRDLLIEGKQPSNTHFTMHADMATSQIAADILSERYALSPNWQKHRIYPETEDMLLVKAVKDSIHRLKLVKIREMILIINEQIRTADEEKSIQLMMKRQALDKAKKKLSAYFGSVVIE